MKPNLFTIQDKAFPRGLQYAVVDYSLENSEPVQIVQQFSLFIVAYVISSVLQASRFAQVCISKPIKVGYESAAKENRSKLKFLIEFELFRFITFCIGLTGGTAAIGLGLGGILGLGIGLNASAAGASIGGDATVSGLRNNIHYGKEEKALDKKIQEFKTEIAGIKHDYERRHLGVKCYYNN